MTGPTDRRSFLRKVAMAAVAGVAWACGGSSSTSSPTTSSPARTSSSTTPDTATTTVRSATTTASESTTSATDTTQPPQTTEQATSTTAGESLRRVDVAPGSLAEAVAAAQPGDELHLLEGRHRGVIPIAGVSGTSERPIVISAAAGAVMQQCMLRFAKAEHWELRGLRFEGRLVAAASIWINDGRGGADVGAKGPCSGIAVIDTHFVDVRRGERKDTHALRIDGGSSDITIRNCVSDTTSADAVQIQNAERIVIEDCHFFVKRPFPAGDDWDNTGENGIDIKRADDVTVRRCVIEGFQEVDSDNIESTSAGAEGIVVHKFGVVGLLVEDCTFRANRNDIKIAARTKLTEIPQVSDYAKDGRWSRDVVIRRCTFVGGPVGHDDASLGAELAIQAAPGNVGLLRHIGVPERVPEIVVEDCVFEGTYSKGPLVETTREEFKGAIRIG